MLVIDQVDLTRKARDFLHASIRRDHSRRRRGINVLSVLLILALAAAGFVVVLQLGLAAHRIHPDGETHSSLFNTLTAGPYAGTLTGHKGSVNAVAFASDRRTPATGSSDNTVILGDFTTDRAQP